MVYNIQLRFDKRLKSKLLNLARTLECCRIINTPNGYAPNVSALVTQNSELIEKDFEELAQFQQRLFNAVMLRNMYGHNRFVIEEEFHPLNLEPVCMLVSSVQKGRIKHAETLMEKLEWPLVGFLEKTVVVNISNDVPTHVAIFSFVKSAPHRSP
ncbi:hypothetical protein Q3G72_032850 [Acer saccharum]|nr:hypothetical protein Q3G72_032850 [Acer saccharum]